MPLAAEAVLAGGASKAGSTKGIYPYEHIDPCPGTIPFAARLPVLRFRYTCYFHRHTTLACATNRSLNQGPSAHGSPVSRLWKPTTSIHCAKLRATTHLPLRS